MTNSISVMFTTRTSWMGSKFVWFKDAAADNRSSVLNGNKILNPFKGQGFAFAADLFEYRLAGKDNEEGGGYLLKVYKLKTAKTGDVLIFDANKSHPIEVGDRIMVAPDLVTTTGKFATVISVEVDKTAMEYKVTISTADSTGIGSVAAGKVFVEAGEGAVGASVKVLVANPNSFVLENINFDIPTNGTLGFQDVEYRINTIRGSEAFIERMSPIPPYVLNKNKSLIDGLFSI